METFPSSGSLVLVAVLPKERDLEIARLLGWYRIPLRFAPKVIEVDYLAFYQPASFGEEHRWQIEYFAAVRGHELTTRKELLREEKDHDKANEEYYKILIGPLQELPMALPARKWRRITFLYSLGELFPEARNVEDLVVRSDERRMLWQSLKERAVRNGQYQVGTEQDFSIDPELLAFFSGVDGDNFMDVE
jgi:hypothetical protein